MELTLFEQSLQQVTKANETLPPNIGPWTWSTEIDCAGLVSRAVMEGDMQPVRKENPTGSEFMKALHRPICGRIVAPVPVPHSANRQGT